MKLVVPFYCMSACVLPAFETDCSQEATFSISSSLSNYSSIFYVESDKGGAGPRGEDSDVRVRLTAETDPASREK